MKSVIQKESMVELFGYTLKLIERSDVPEDTIYFMSNKEIVVLTNLSSDSQEETPQ
jgi:hypothetical protein